MSSLKMKNDVKYELIAPDGGWGHILNIGGILMVGFTVVPISSFALIFGPYLSTFYDEISATTTVYSVFSTSFYATGLLANFLFLKLSFRKVAVMGALIYCFGSFASIFVFNLQFLVFSYGILQGIGTGLIVPAVIVATNEYFDHRKMVVFAVCQAVVALLSMIYPGFTRLMLDNFGFRGTQAIFAALSLHTILGALTLQPVKWHMKKVLLNKGEHTTGSTSYSSTLNEMESHQLLDSNASEKSFDNKEKHFQSLESLTNCHKATPQENRKGCFLQNLFDLSILKEATYWNIAVGLSLCITSEMNLMALMPIFLSNVGFTDNEITLLMTIYFMSDLITKIIISVITLFWKFKSRYVFLGNIAITVALRIVFTEINLYWWTIVLTAFLGSSRCIIQLSHPMVLAELYPKQFSSAYSLCMVFTGISSIIMGSIMGLVKYKTQSDAMVLHVLTFVCLFCAITWTLELLYKRFVFKNVKK
ncbi:monocarboxylate transporter 9 isoform X1 [Agrilus planipennis]|uniref:Monocarboxylate transporter 9 isoform X1 n=1 Tax=Agrilus planipennis TaxID=224129 RepID=A0A1W4XGX8_AGRPL|nr:monocarboxylate transporter 9 isoform X1 [Agrilus planipennis]